MPYEKLQPSYDASMATLTDALDTIAQLSDHLTLLASTYHTCHSIKAGRHAQLDGRLPMWPCAPTSEQLTDRDGNGTYLYLYWSLGEGPQPNPNKPPQRKTYIGARPANITLARTMVTNHQAYTKLLDTLEQLRRTAQYITADLSRTAAHANRAITTAHNLVNGGDQ